MDGNSINYTENSDGTYHDKVDADPVSEYDPEIRKKVGKKWKSPSAQKGSPDYYDRDKSEEKTNERLKE